MVLSRTYMSRRMRWGIGLLGFAMGCLPSTDGFEVGIGAQDASAPRSDASGNNDASVEPSDAGEQSDASGADAGTVDAGPGPWVGGEHGECMPMVQCVECPFPWLLSGFSSGSDCSSAVLRFTLEAGHPCLCDSYIANMPVGVQDAIMVAPDHLVVATTNGKMVSFDAFTGALRWEQDITFGVHRLQEAHSASGPSVFLIAGNDGEGPARRYRLSDGSPDGSANLPTRSVQGIVSDPVGPGLLVIDDGEIRPVAPAGELGVPMVGTPEGFDYLSVTGYPFLREYRIATLARQSRTPRDYAVQLIRFSGETWPADSAPLWSCADDGAVLQVVPHPTEQRVLALAGPPSGRRILSYTERGCTSEFDGDRLTHNAVLRSVQIATGEPRYPAP